MQAALEAAPPDDNWGDLLLDNVPNVGLLDDFQIDYGLHDTGLHSLELDFGAAGGVAATGSDVPASSDLLESLQLDAAAFAQPASSSGARHSPRHSGSDSPAALPLVDTAAPTSAVGAHAAVPVPGSSGGGSVSPATSESENMGRGRSHSPAGASSQRGAQAGSGAAAQPQRPLTDEEKRLARMQRNRENAQLSRQRKKQQMADMEARCALLTQQNAALAGAVQRLTAENAALRQQLVLVCQQAGRSSGAAAAAAAKPAQPAPAAGVAAAASSASAQPAAAAAAPAARGLLPQWPLLGMLPKVTFTAQQPPRAPGQPAAAQPAAGAPQAAAARAPAAPAAPAARAAPAAPATAQRPAKRSRTAAAGASTAFLALFSLFMFAGPLTPAPLAAPGTPGSGALASIAGAGVTGSQRMLQALPEAPGSAAAGALEGAASLGDGSGLHRAGRGLQALPAAAVEGGAAPLHPHQAPQPRLPRDGRHMQALLNSTLQALLLEPGNAALEAAALRRLQELGPVALLLDADAPGAAPGSNPLAASVAFPSLAGQLFGAAGLEVPQVCQKVLEFDAASVPHAVRSRRSLERYVLGATGFKGRSLAAVGGGGSASGPAVQPGSTPQPLRIDEPPSGVAIGEDAAEDEAEALPGGGLDGSSGTALLPAGAGESAGPVLVSVLLPANASGGAKLAGVDKVFVVLLHPQDKYATYSCSLPRPVVL